MNALTGLLTRPAHRFLILLLIADLFFVVLYALYGFKYLSDPRFGLIEDRSYGEVFQYIKEIWIVVLFLCLVAERRTWRYLLWAAVFFYLLLDDSCQFHETAGGWITRGFGISPVGTLHAQDIGEILYSGTVGGGLVGCLLLSFYRAPVDYRRNASRLLILLFLLAFFGIAVDAIRIEGYWLIGKAIGALEDGGEQVVMSVITWFTYHISTNGAVDQPHPQLAASPAPRTADSL